MWPSPSAAATLRIVVANVALARLEPTDRRGGWS
jgi:hypothetical protein